MLPEPDNIDSQQRGEASDSAMARTGAKTSNSRALKRPAIKRAIIDSSGDVLTSRPHGVRFTYVEGDQPYVYRPATYDGVLFGYDQPSIGLFSINEIAAHLATIIPSLQTPIHQAVYINQDGSPFLTVTWEELRQRGRDGWTVTVVSVDSAIFSRVFIARTSDEDVIADALRTAAARALAKAQPPAARSGKRTRTGPKKSRRSAPLTPRKALPPGSGGGK